MKAASIVLLALLLVSMALLGCIEKQPSTEAPKQQISEQMEQVFESEGQAFDALAKELEGIEDLGMEELEQALQE